MNVSGLFDPLRWALSVLVDELLGETERKKCADAEPMRKGGGSMEAGADDNAPYDFRKLFKKKPVISARYHPPLPIYL